MIDYSIVKRLIRSGLTVSAMESCTGGLLASTITDCSGASDIFPGSFVTYGNEAKINCGVPAAVIERFGVYSPETAAAMARACAEAYGTQLGIGVTGTLGRKDPGNNDSVPGKVYFSILFRGKCTGGLIEIPGELQTRPEMKEYTVSVILQSLARLLDRSL